MKKLLEFGVMCLVLMFVSCDGSNKYIAQAEDDNPIDDSGLFGELPGLLVQKEVANDLLTQSFRENFTEALTEAQADKLVKNKKKEKIEIDKYFDKKIYNAIECLVGKKVPASCDRTSFSSVKCRISRIDSTHVGTDAELVLAVDLPKQFASVFRTYKKNRRGKDETVAEYLERSGFYAKGKIITLHDPIMESQMDNLKEIYFFEKKVE